MSRKLSLVILLLAFSVTSLFAQSSLNIGAIQKKIETSNEAIQNPKKNTKSATWLSRGDVFLEAATASGTGLYQGQAVTELQFIFSRPQGVETKVIGGESYVVLMFPHVTVYTKDEVVYYWEQITVIEEGALEQSYDSYIKAYEMDPKVEKKALVGVESVVNAYKQTAHNKYGLLDVKAAADNFWAAYQAALAKPMDVVDTLAVYNAGFLYTFAKDFEKGEKALRKSIEYGYENDGEAYFYLFHCLYGQNDMDGATDALLTGLKKYPNNIKIVEGLVGIYTSNPDKDPKEIVAIVESALEKDDKNEDLWIGLGRVYDKLGDRAQSVNAFKKATEINPKSFIAYFSIGFSYIMEGDAMSKELSEKPMTSVAEHRARVVEINNIFFNSIEPLEKALEIEPDNKETLELLKNVTFRLRARSEEIKQKNLKYDEMFKSMK